MNDSLWLIWSIEHRAWWRSNWGGYTEDRQEAGAYDYEEALKIVRGANGHRHRFDPPNEAMILYEIKNGPTSLPKSSI